MTDSERHRLLSVDRRRTTLDVLAETTDSVDLDDLAQAVATRESEPDEPSQQTVDRTAVALHHNHLPAMDEADVVEYDTDGKRAQSRVTS